jgi:hypothetical protein
MDDVEKQIEDCKEELPDGWSIGAVLDQQTVRGVAYLVMIFPHDVPPSKGGKVIHGLGDSIKAAFHDAVTQIRRRPH